MDYPTRRTFLRQSAWAVAMGMAGRLMAQPQPASPATTQSAESIDRRAVVSRHNVTLKSVDLGAPLQVGNGEFAFTCDVTGLQTLAAAHRPKVPLYTMAQWAWHADPAAASVSRDVLRHEYDVAGRKVPYYHVDAEGKGKRAYDTLRANPHRFSLGQIALVFGDRAISIDDIADVSQTLDVFGGTIRSSYRLRGEGVQVTTLAHPTLSAVALRIESGALRRGLAVRVAFPYADGTSSRPDDWNADQKHQTAEKTLEHGILFERTLDATSYHARIGWSPDVTVEKPAAHTFDLRADADRFDLVIEFGPRPFDAPLPGFEEVGRANEARWASFWTGGAAIDFGACTDARAAELERRVVLSQYLTAVNCAGSLPPQETGLLLNSWHGKFHVETHWWHAAHFATWDRFDLLERSLGYYSSILDAARGRANEQGYAGARWPKLSDPTGINSPSAIGSFLIWQQPHPIYFSELAYRAQRTRKTLEQYADVVDASAQFMASFVQHDVANDRFELGPPLTSAQSGYDRLTARNPTFELAYWVWGLGVAQKWRERLGRPREPLWDAVMQKMSKPVVREGRYMAIGVEPFLIDNDHPSYLQAFGFLPKTHLIDEKTMLETAKWTMKKWKWNTAWGWDFAVLAQTAARLGDAELAVDALMIESVRNTYNINGHNPQRDTLPAYLPGNGALLAAVGMMAGGWDGLKDPTTPAPGFPKHGRWNVKAEGFRPAI